MKHFSGEFNLSSFSAYSHADLISYFLRQGNYALQLGDYEQIPMEILRKC